MSDYKELLVIALGGNALVESEKDTGIKAHLRSIERTSSKLTPLFELNYDIVLTHGNGPQVGNILIQNEEASSKVPSMPLDVCVAESQGEIGYLLQQSLLNHLKKRGIKKEVVTILTQVLVNKKDGAFEKPSKPVGPFYTKENARTLSRTKKWIMKEDSSGKGYRRVVPSPRPIHIIETRIIHQLLFLNQIPISVGGGGIPVTMDEKGSLTGVEAVIDKDLASARLAIDLKADKFIMLTNVPNCYLNFKKKSQTAIKEMNLDEAQTYLEQGQFASGSMEPKVQAAVDYLINGGKEVYITSIDKLLASTRKKAGTFVHY